MQLLVLLGAVLFCMLAVCSAKENEPSTDSQKDKKASSVKQAPPAGKKLKAAKDASVPVAEKPKPVSDENLDIPLLSLTPPEEAAEENERALDSGVTVKRQLEPVSATAANRQGAGAIAVDGSSPLKRQPAKEQQQTREAAGAVLVRDGDSIDVQTAGAPAPPAGLRGNAGAPPVAKQTNKPPAAKASPVKPDTQPKATATSASKPATAGKARPDSSASQPGKSQPAKTPAVLATDVQPEPAATAPVAGSEAAEPSLREYFSDSADASGSELGMEGEELVEDGSSTEPPIEPALLIASASTPVKPSSTGGNATDESLSSVVGRDVPQVNAWQSLLSLLAVLGLFIGLVHLYQRFRLGGKSPGSRKSLQVIETIGLGPGRQIVIVELQRDALVLGMTPHSINLLDKVPMQALDGSYRDTVDSIISRESTQPQRWAERPAFRMELGGAISMPRLSGMANGHGQPLTVAQLRQARATNGTSMHSVLSQDDHSTKAELIERIRQQLRHMED